MWKLGKVEVSPGFPALILAAIWIGAGEVLPLVMLAAVCHELGHLAALRLAGVRVERLRLTAFGAELRADTRYMSYGREILCILAGPAVNLLLALLLARVSGDYLLAGANLIQGIFNLLPMPSLDGGRILHLIVSWLTEPMTADRVCGWVGVIAALLLAGAAMTVVFRHGTGVFLLIPAVGGVLSVFSREIGQLPLAKAVKNG